MARVAAFCELEGRLQAIIRDDWLLCQPPLCEPKMCAGSQRVVGIIQEGKLSFDISIGLIVLKQ